MEKRNPLKNAKVIVRHSPLALKILLIVVILLSMAALVTLRLVHNGLQAEIQDLKEQAADYEHANEILDERLEDPDSVDNVKDIAREELGLVDPHAFVIDPQEE